MFDAGEGVLPRKLPVEHNLKGTRAALGAQGGRGIEAVKFIEGSRQPPDLFFCPPPQRCGRESHESAPPHTGSLEGLLEAIPSYAVVWKWGTTLSYKMPHMPSYVGEILQWLELKAG